MRLVRRYGAVVSTVGLAALLATTMDLARAQVAPPSLAIERDPPTATKPMFTPPVLVPSIAGPPVSSGPAVPPQPIHIPAGPGSVVVPSAPPVKIIQPPAPAVVQSSAPVKAPEPPPQQTKPDEPVPTAPTTPAEPPAGPTPAAPATPATTPTEPVPGGPVPPPVPAPGDPAKSVPNDGAPTAPASAANPTQPPVALPVPSTSTPPGPPPVSPAPPVSSPTTEAPQPSPPVATQLVPVEVEVEARSVIFVTGVTTWEKAEEKLGGVFVQLAQAAKKLGVQQAGPPLVEYIESDSDDVGFRAMVPIDAAPKGKPPKGVKIGKSTGGKALKFRHAGPLDDLEEVYGRIDDELAKRNVDTRAIVEEYDADALASPEDRVVMDIYVFPK